MLLETLCKPKQARKADNQVKSPDLSAYFA
jgi:hypothetical protein